MNIKILIAFSLMIVATDATAQACVPWNGPGAVGSSLQDAVNKNACVQLGSGTFILESGIIMPSGHTLQGQGGATVLKADQATWQFGCCDFVVTSVGSSGVTVKNLTIDGSGIATYAAGAMGMTIDNVSMSNGRCSAVGIAGTGMVVENSVISVNAIPTSIPGRGIISCASGGGGGVALGAGIYGQGTGSYFAPQILNNVIAYNNGPAMDINGVWGGTFSGNNVFGNQGWAAVSLYGASYWTVSYNSISHPSDQPGQPYHADCARGPAGGHSAGIFLCEDTDQNGLVTINNTITNNATSSFYGILSVGAIEKAPYLVPRNNVFTGNNVIGSYFGCADNFAPGQWYADTDVWSGNTCAGTANTSPTYFH